MKNSEQTEIVFLQKRQVRVIIFYSLLQQTHNI